MAGPGQNDGVLARGCADVAEGFLALSARQPGPRTGWLGLAGSSTPPCDISRTGQGFFDTADDAPALVRRPRDPGDNAEPSGWLATAKACLTYAALTGRGDLREVAERALGLVTGLAERVSAKCRLGAGSSISHAVPARWSWPWWGRRTPGHGRLDRHRPAR
jgi:hypothetical protein